MWQRLESFNTCVINCKSSFRSSTLADHLSVLSGEEVQTAMRHILNGEKTSNPTLKKLFTSIRGQSSSIGHSNEAASYARQKLFSLWYYFGAPAVFFTVTPCDECSFRVRLYATSKEHALPNINEIQDQKYCLLDFNTRKKVRSKYPGACAIEYQNIMQIVINILIGWDSKSKLHNRGIFGIPLAYADCCEEQARYTLHSHISVWVEGFNKVRNLLFHESMDIRNMAREELQKYFDTIAQASLGDLYDHDTNSDSKSKGICKISDVLIPPKDQDLRHMRHHVHCQNLHGVVGYYPINNTICQTEQNDTIQTIDSKTIVEKNTGCSWVKIV